MIQLHHVVTADDLARDFVPIGTPISGVEALLVNERGEACATGETGEIVIRSRFLTLGYRGDAAATPRRVSERTSPAWARLAQQEAVTDEQ